MKREGVLVGLFFVLLIFGLNFAFAVVPGESEAVEKAYSCLENTIQDKTCAQLSLEDQIFSLLSVGKCKDQVLAASDSSNYCWPKGNCDLRLTSLATLALNSLEINVTNYKNWILDQEGTPTVLEWLLEVDTSGNASCSIYQGNEEYQAEIFEDETVNIGTNACLSVEQTYGGYWFQIDPSCYDKEFTISCDKSFLTTLLFKKSGENTLFVLDQSHESSALGETYESIDSSCFKKGTFCDYEGSLWASIVLDYLNEDSAGIVPYLLTERTDNLNFLPDAFLYFLTGKLEFKTGILEKQINGKYWRVDEDKFYDTSVALLPLQSETLPAKESAKNWLIENQEESGCWNNDDITDTAFLLYSVWSEPVSAEATCTEAGFVCVENTSSCNGTLTTNSCESGVCCNEEGNIIGVGEELLDCVASGNFCMSGRDCGAENILYEYDCIGIQKCCSIEKVETTCFNLDGLKCTSNQYCSQGTERSTDDLIYGETCCVGGTCELVETETETEYTCTINSGVCEQFECDSGYSQSSAYTCEYGDLCCFEDLSSKKSYLWVWILLILIALVVVAILFREKIQEFFLNMGKGKGTVPTNKGPPGFPPSYSRSPGPRPPMQRRMLPPQQRPPVQRPMSRSRPQVGAPKELDDVLKKLKSMSE